MLVMLGIQEQRSGSKGASPTISRGIDGVRTGRVVDPTGVTGSRVAFPTIKSRGMGARGMIDLTEQVSRLQDNLEHPGDSPD